MNTSFTVTADDPDEARRIASDTLYPQRMTVLDARSPLRMTMHGIRLGSVFIGDCIYRTDVRIACGDLVTSYHVNLPLSGHLLSRHRNQLVDADTTTAAVYGPVGDTELMRWEGDCRQLCVKIDKGALEQSLVQSLGDDLPFPLVLAPSLDVRQGPGRSWARLVQMVAAEAVHADSVMHQPLVAPQLAEAIIFGLTTTIGHRSRAPIDETVAVRPPVIARAIDYLHDHVTDPVSVADVAGHCGISVRSLQDGFQRHVGMSPSAYLRTLRVRGVRDELVEKSPELATVAAIAHRWGFVHLGRFAALYRAEFRESPSETLRRRIY